MSHTENKNKLKVIRTEEELEDIVTDIFDYFYNEDRQILSYYLKSNMSERKIVRLSEKGFRWMVSKLKEKK